MVALCMRGIGCLAAVAMILMFVGCSSTPVTFNGPPGSVLTIDHKPHHLPAQVELWRPTPGESARYDASLVFTTQDSREIRANGFINVFGYDESDVDRVASITYNLDEAQLVKLQDGAVLVFKAQTASRQPLFELTLKNK